MLFANKFCSHLIIHNAFYASTYLQKCLSFQYESSKLLSVQSQQLEQSLKYIYN